MTTFYIRSLGCKVSQYDGERIAEKLKEYGLEEQEECPDVFILNGCSVTGRASQKARQLIRAVKRKKNDSKIVLAGCEARLVKKHNETVPEVDWLLPYSDIDSINEMMSALSLDIKCDNTESATKIQHTGMTRAYLKVQDGCSQFCSYCIVAHLRGPEWSRPIDDAIKEAKELIDEGHKEIVLTGIHVGHYKPSLVPLLKELEKLDGLERIRLSSIESVEVKDELIDWVANSPKACHHFHLPLQSGCDKILKAMHRPYLAKDFKAVVEHIRESMPEAAITTDLIVGFPGETEEDFQETLNFLDEIQFSRFHIFRYSKRDGTPAAVMPNQISNEIKIARSDRVEKVWKKYANNFAKHFEGHKVEVLWETLEDGWLKGYSKEYVPCKLKSDDTSLKNKLMTVTGIKAEENELIVEKNL
ncbi:MAG: tRNA (N(6)-L-threonylcarbamoyladenosine(37)-C(2))-methylthiotransferase MtaB [Candidatus Riflebacteria bacterium]|nr:tRNA (N(6)-L-threonylcarbamoyladenosine(37)-C(2))-methylthiotransferase MtaB [Candidatus Riflebacteria bacterium]